MDGASAGGVSYSLIVHFPDQSASFAFGFAAGQIWAEMKRNERAELMFDTAAENREVIRRMAEYLGWSVTVTPTDIAGWDKTVLAKVSAEGSRVNPCGLHVV